MPSGRSPERIAYALQALAADLAAERRRVLLLRRENRVLTAKLAALQYELDRLSPDGRAAGEDVPGATRRPFPLAS